MFCIILKEACLIVLCHVLGIDHINNLCLMKKVSAKVSEEALTFVFEK
jgi:hypothetical protein